jgi:hypothetical protein
LKHFARTGYGQICADIEGTLIENPRVGGSIPPLGTNLSSHRFSKLLKFNSFLFFSEHTFSSIPNKSHHILGTNLGTALESQTGNIASFGAFIRPENP